MKRKQVSRTVALTGAQRWNALQKRDPSAEGQFVYAVSSTGIYCRPVCPSKLALRENVSFYNTPAEAEAAGFRACKRCRPDGESQSERNSRAIAQACRFIESAESSPSLTELARAAGMSRFHFHRLFKQTTGVTPQQYGASHRAAKIQQELRGKQTVTAAIYAAGFNSSGRFYESSNQRLGMTPGEYRTGGAGNMIRYAVTKCTLGWVLIAGTRRGICSVRFGASNRALFEELRGDFPEAEFAKPDHTFTSWVKAVVRQIDQPGPARELPLDIRGTAFQQRVWLALRGIPPGTTLSYTELAAKIGRPTAVRAVARACATNPVAVIVPCHRVVGKSGALSGYRWGLERKRKLLKREQSR